MPEKIIELRHIRKRFGTKTVVDDVDLSVERGTVLGLVGLNGAGKTTIIRIMLGLLRPDEGECRVFGADPWRHEPSLYRRTGVVLEHNGFWGNLSVIQNMRFFAAARGLDRGTLDTYMEKWWKNTAVSTKKGKVKYFSRGEKMQCALCRAFAGGPEAYFLDEPVVALDIRAYDHFCSLVKDAAACRATLVISSHQLDTIEELCDSVALLENGRLRLIDLRTAQAAKWMVRTGEDPRARVCIESAAGSVASYSDGAYRFEIPTGETRRIAAVVSGLSVMGCEILEVREERNGLRESLRRYYAGPNEQPPE
jgi:ABC-type multidrug transport system ATPase subunit